MAWRTVVINNPARLKYKSKGLVVEQDEGSASVPLEDVACLIIDNPQVTITAQLLSACADNSIAVISVDKTHTPNGIFLPYLPHSRALKVIRQQLAISLPHKKRIWQQIIRQKLLNQSDVLLLQHSIKAAENLRTMAGRVKSGDTDNLEAWGAQIYFIALFGKKFTRGADLPVNGALNYGYAVVRSAIARSLVSFGFLTAFGIHHDNEQNQFNLADDLLEPYRPFVDNHIIALGLHNSGTEELDSALKAYIAGVLHMDAPRITNGAADGSSTVLALIDATVISLAKSMGENISDMVLPGIAPIGI